MSPAARWLLAFGAVLATAAPWGPFGDAQYATGPRSWPLAANDTIWDASSVVAASANTVAGWEDYIVRNWDGNRHWVCTRDNYGLLMNALDTNKYHFGTALYFTPWAIRQGQGRVSPGQ